MASSDDDMPLAASKHRTNGLNGARAPISSSKIPAKVDAALDKKDPPQRGVMPGLSISNGPVTGDTPMKDAPNGVTNGVASIKRKARESIPKPRYAEAESSDDDVPLSKKRKTKLAEANSDDEPLVSRAKNSKLPPQITASQIGEDSDSDTPLGQKLIQEKRKIDKAAEREGKALLKKEKKEKGQEKPVKKSTAKKLKEESDSDDTPLAAKAPASKSSKAKALSTTLSATPAPKAGRAKALSATLSATPGPKSKGKSIKKEATVEPDDVDEDDDEEEANWWDDPTKGDGSNKWETLQHSGVVFPPPYEPLPKSVKMKYDGQPVSMHPDAEEVAGFFGGMLNSTHNVENPTFQKNFFNDFKEILKKTGGATNGRGEKVAIKEFSKCDFQPVFQYYDAQREAKKALSKEEKKQNKAEKDAMEAPYMYCLWDGKKQKVGNFRVEPPGLFRGRGEHPKTGKVKTRVPPEQITINIGKEATVPPPPPGHKWKEIKHDKTGTWLAMWQENVNGNYKYVMLAANSDVKGQSDYKKFERARELKKHIARIRKDYEKELKAELMSDRQRATAVYLIDRFALRAGNEKGDDEADTVGCCSLKFEHVTLREPDTVIFDFLGKDSIRFHEEFKVDHQVFKNLKIFKKAPKKDGDEIFDRLTTTQLNKHLQNYMSGLTAKVFRTFNASYTMAKILKDIHAGGTIPEKIKAYNDANRKVAILCNHKRTVAASHANAMEKLDNRLKGLKYQQWRVKQMILDLDSKQKKKRGASYFELPEDLDDEWIVEHHQFLVEELRTKITKKFEKENEKLKAEGEKEMKVKELEERLKEANELEKTLKKEFKTKKVEAEGRSPTIEKLETNIEKLDTRIATMAVQAQDKEDNKEVALGTSKINYIDPRLTVVFSKKFNVPIERFFSKTLREKFEWAIKSADEDWEF